MIGIYKFTNRITGKSYIGQSRNIQKRYNQHKTRHEINNYNPIPKEDTYFHSILRHYGFKNFDFEILEECTIDELNDKEIYYIEKYNTLFPYGYNKDKGGNKPHPIKLASYEEVDEIIKLLKTSKMSNIEIGNKFGVSDQTVSDINSGRMWYRENETYPIRNGRLINAKKYYCFCCGKEQKYKSKTGLCVQCYISRITDYLPDKDTLYDLLLHNSFRAVGKIYGVSDNAVKKWCDKYDIPRHASYYRDVA